MGDDVSEVNEQTAEKRARGGRQRVEQCHQVRQPRGIVALCSVESGHNEKKD